MRRSRATKIIATVGPACRTPECLADLFQSGADVFRLNFSHGEHADHAASHKTIRELEARFDRPIAILADLQGPKHRVGTFADGGADIKMGQRFILDSKTDPGDAQRVRLPHPELFAALEPGAKVLVDDGKLRFSVIECGPDFANLEAELDGRISNRKGVNIPGRVIPGGALTNKDLADLRFALELGVDWVAQSFVQSAADVAELRKLVDGQANIMAKIEKPAAVDGIDEILDLCDAIMVARGDLGVECPMEDVPLIQKSLVRRCRAEGKPVVVATQMLDSMISRPMPTRAEGTDVAGAVFDGADAVMLSGETAAGDYPVLAVQMMNRIIERTESSDIYAEQLHLWQPTHEPNAADAVTAAARLAAQTINAKVIVTYTHSGSTALRMARERPNTPLIALTPSQERARRLCVVWGLHSELTSEPEGLQEMTLEACDRVRASGFAEAGDRLVVTAGFPFGVPGTTNIMRVAYA